MKALKYILVALLALLTFASCEKETEGVSRVTYYPEFKVNEGVLNLVALGSDWTDPGVEATLLGEDVTSQIKVEGSVNTEEAGLYTMTYTVINKDNLPWSVERQVIVCDITPSDMVSGLYTVSKSSNRTNEDVVVEYGSEFTILIYQVSPGKFYVSDLFGGYYDQRAGYGAQYAMEGEISLSGSNEISLEESHVAGWGDGLDGLTNGSLDPDTKTVKWTVRYAGLYDFNVIATPQ